MNEQQKVIRFPSRRASKGAMVSSDEQMASNIRAAWRKLWRVIKAAKAAGLTIETKTMVEHDPPSIERRL